MFGSSNDGSPDKESLQPGCGSPSPSKKKILNILIEEKVPKKTGDQSNSSYCGIYWIWNYFLKKEFKYMQILIREVKYNQT